MAIDLGLDDPAQLPDEQKKPDQPQQATLSGNPLVDFFKAGGGGTIRGAQNASGDLGVALGTIANMQGLKDWGTKTTQEVAQSTPDYTGHHVLGAINSTMENVGGALAPIVGGMVAAAAAPEEAASSAALAAGALTMAPIGFGSAKTEAIARGADDETANRIGIESGLAQGGLFMLPLHQILSGGGPILERVLTNAAINAGVGGALSYGQEEIMKANDVRPLPDGSEFNNTVYSTIIGGLTGMVFGAFSPDEMTPRVNAIVDTTMVPQLQAQLEAQYVAQGMDPQQAAVKALDMVTDKRPQMIQEAQNMYNQARFSISNLLKGNYEKVNNGKIPDPIKVYARDPAGMKTEYELTYQNAPKETNEEASTIIEAAFSIPKYEIRRDSNNDPVLDPATKRPIKDVVVDPDTKFPIIEKTMTPDMPKVAKMLLQDTVVKRLQEGDDKLKIYNAIKTRSLPVLDRHALVYTGAAHGEPSESQNSLYHYNMGVLKVSEVAKNMLDSNGNIHPEGVTIYHLGDHEGADQVWESLMQSYKAQNEMKVRTNQNYPAALPPEMSEQDKMIEHLLGQARELLRSKNYDGLDILFSEMNPGYERLIKQTLIKELNEQKQEPPPQPITPQQAEEAQRMQEDGQENAALQQFAEQQVQKAADEIQLERIQHQKDLERQIMEKDTDDSSQEVVDSMYPMDMRKELGVTPEMEMKQIEENERSKDIGIDWVKILKSSIDEKKIDNNWNQSIDPEGKVNTTNKEDIAKALEGRTKGLEQEAQDDIVNKIFEMIKQKGPALQNHVETQLGPQMTGKKIESPNLVNKDGEVYPRTLPLKLMYGASSMFGRQENFLNWARAHYGQEFAQKFQVKPPADIAQEIIQGFKTDRTTKDLIRHIATDNLSGAMKESWRIATGLTGMLQQKGLVKDVKRSTIQTVNRMFGELLSLASEERRANGEKTYLGTQRQIGRSGQPGTKDEWRVRDNFTKVYMDQLKFWGMPMPDPQELGVRPELAFTNMMHQLAGDHAEKLLMWTKNEMEEPSFQAMVKAGVFEQTGIMANVAFGYSPRIHDLKGAQKEYQQGRGTVGNPTTSSGVLQRDAYDYSDFLVRSQEQGLDTVGHYIDAMSEYVQQSLGKAMQYNTLNWLRMFRIPNTDKLGIPGHETAEIREIIKNLNYVEYANSQNIRALSEKTGLTANAVLEHLGYFNKKDAEGLVGWNKFHFEKPFMQGSLSDVLDFYYPKILQNETMSTITGVLNAPKWAMVFLDPLQHVALFSTAVLGNSVLRMPIVMGRYAKNAIIALANMPFALHAYAKGEPQGRLPLILGGGPIEPGYDNQQNLAKFLTYGHGAAMGALPEGMFQDQKIVKYLIPEMMSSRQGWDAALQSTVGATKIMFGHFLQREIYNVTNQRYNQFRNMVDSNGNKMTDEEAARRAVNLVNSTSGVVHPSDFGPYGPAWSLLTFARGLTIAPLRVITGITEPTLRKIYGNTNKFKIDPISGMLNPIRMGDLGPKDADFLQAYYAQHLAKIIAMRVLAAGVVQYGLSFLDDDKKDEFGQEGHDPLNKKRFIYNNPAGMRMGIRTPWVNINGQREVLNPTPFREASQLVDMTGIGSKYKFPESLTNWMKNRLNVWEGLMLSAAYGVDFGTGQEIPGKGTDEYGDELTKWMLAKVMPLSLGLTQEEKQQRIEEPGAQAMNQLGAFFGTTPGQYPKNWSPGYEEKQRIEKEFQEKKLQAKEATYTMTKEEVARMQLTKFFTRKEQQNVEQSKVWNAKKVIQMAKQAREEAPALQAPEPQPAEQYQP